MSSSTINPRPRRRAAVRVWASAGALALVGALASCSEGAPESLVPTDLPTDATNIVYLHHSVGKDIWEGGVEDAVTALGDDRDAPVNIVERHFPHDPYPENRNDPYDYWKLWVDAGDTEYQEQGTLAELAEAYNVIVWKNCFIAADIEVDEATADVASEAKTVANYQLQYEALRDAMLEYPDTTFVVWTLPPKVEAGTNVEMAERAQEFAEWVTDEWEQPGDNIFLWDFRTIATGGDGIYLLDEFAAAEQDSHPNETLAKKAAPLFAARMGAILDGDGDSSSLTGE